MALPVVLTVAIMPFSYSIANGIGVGFIAWVVAALGGRQGARDQSAAVDRRGGLPRLLRARLDRITDRHVTDGRTNSSLAEAVTASRWCSCTA